MYKIEDNIPPPPPRAHFPFAKMKVGQSIRVPEKEAKRARASAYETGRRRGWKFVTRTNAKGVRIWRIK